MKLTLDKIIGVVAAAVTYLIGGVDVALEVLLVLIVLDYVTGFYRAAKQSELSSKEGWNGILRKVLIFVVVCVAHQVDRMVGTGSTVRNVTVAFYCANEGISILENAAASGLPIPEIIKKALKALNETKYPE